MPHQQRAAQRLAGALRVFGGALLADAVGLGKTHVALALATRYRRAVVVAPAALLPQWRRVAASVGVLVEVVSHTALSRGRRLPPTPFVVVDEAHHFRNPETRRYDRLARDRGAADILLTTATPVVNGGADLVHLLRLFLPDNGVAPLGVRSLERAAADCRHERIMHAVSPMVVARSAGSARLTHLLPPARDSRIIRAPTMGSEEVARAVRAVESLRFPSFGVEASALLRLHLLHRLASSRDAYLQSLARHRTYLDRAAAAAARGERLGRAAARALFGTDDVPQLELALGTAHGGNEVALAEFAGETRRLDAAVAGARAAADAPKVRALCEVLARRDGRKTIVFAAATATAEALARALAWRGVVLVTSRRARIASGRLAIDDALSLFAPRARGRPTPRASQAATVLVATDLVSEGLDLHDADAVVHYDLPWTPLRLEQRMGRVARLGSPHRSVEVWWFAPPRVLERRLELARRIREKVTTQLSLAVTSSSRVGRARLVGGLLDLRERMLDADRPTPSGHSVVSGTGAGLCALRWQTAGGTVRELVTLAGKPGVGRIDRLARYRQSARPIPARHRKALRTLVGRREAAVGTGAQNAVAIRLRRLILTRARAAARGRNARLIAQLDIVLERVHNGLPVGAERSLADALATDPPGPALDTWLRDAPARSTRWAGPTVEALIVPA